MSYLQDRKRKNKKNIRIITLFFLVIIFLSFSGVIFSFLSPGFSRVALPLFSISTRIKNNFNNFSIYLSSKKSLKIENENYKKIISENEARLSNYDALFNENEKLKEILLRKPISKKMLLAGIISNPKSSPYDILLLDVGEDDGVEIENTVFAYGNIPIGRVSEVNKNSSKIILFSTPGERVAAVLSGSDTFIELVGRGRGNFEAVLPRDFEILEGTLALLPGVTPYTLAEVSSIISDPRDSYKKALLKSPINIFELKFVEIGIQ